AAIAYAGHLDHVVRVGELAQGAAVAQLELLGFLGRGTQRHGDVVGHLIAGDRNDRGVSDRATGEDGEVSRAAAYIHQTHAQILFVVVEHRQGGGERLQHDVTDLEPAPAHALGDVLHGGNGTGDDVHLDFQPYAAHPEGLAHVLLPVDDE